MTHRPIRPSSAQPLPEPAVIAQQDIRSQPFITVAPVAGTVRSVTKHRSDPHVRPKPGGPGDTQRY
jgi:hypothetical protein